MLSRRSRGEVLTLPVTDRRDAHLPAEVSRKPTAAGVANPFHNQIETVVGFAQKLACSLKPKEAQFLKRRRLELLAEQIFQHAARQPSLLCHRLDWAFFMNVLTNVTQRPAEARISHRQ